MIDDRDRIILEELKRDASQSITKLSKKTGLPRTTVGERIRRMVAKQIIKKFTVMIDYEKIGLPITAFILVSFLPNPEISQRQLAKRISKMKNVSDVYIVSGEWDLILKVRGKSMEEIGELIIDHLRGIKGVGRTVTCTSFTTVTENI